MHAGRRWRRIDIKTVRRLYSKDEEFQLIWDDYRLARKARRHFRVRDESERTEEYARMCEELANEIRQYINRRGQEDSRMRKLGIFAMVTALASWALPVSAGEVLSGAAVGAGVGMITGVGAGAGAVGGAIVGGVKKHNNKKEEQQQQQNDNKG